MFPIFDKDGRVVRDPATELAEKVLDFLHGEDREEKSRREEPPYILRGPIF